MAIDSLGSNRDQLVNLAIADRERLISQQVLIGDSRRWRPRWFDGRFLAASDLQAEQNYFLVRQSDIARAGGSGVVDGLMVAETTASGVDRLRIEPGSGVTDTGELVVLPETLLVDPSNIPEIERLDAAFGLQVIPNVPGRNRTGLYVLALRLVEWTANPIGAYPTSLTGPRTVEDGTIVEGVAVSLIPYSDSGNEENWNRRRARVAREIFGEGRDRGTNSGVLPLALVALRGNVVEWVDPFMVRRETGAERPAGMDFGFGARALREAHLLQYQRHLADVLDLQSDQPFAATAYFDVLPPVGQFPSGTINADRLTQRFFPPGIEVELSFVPEDELSALIEESLLLPPIDLTDKLSELQGAGVIVLVPLSRREFNQRKASLPNWDAELPQLRATFQVQSQSTPIELLLAENRAPEVVAAEPLPEEAAWRQLLRDALPNRLLWYVRRRNLPIPSNVAGTPVSATNVSVSNPRLLIDLMRRDGVLIERLNRMRSVDSPEAALLMGRLSESRLVERPAILKSIVARAAGEEGGAIRAEDLVEKLAPAADARLGDGLTAIERKDEELGKTLNSDKVAETGVLVDVDRIAREVPPERFDEFSGELKEAAKEPATLNVRVQELKLKFARQ